MNAPNTRPPRGFTLIELLVVIAIIVVLAGLTIGGMGYVQQKQAREQAKVQIGMLQMALEEYKADTGQYPGEDPDAQGQVGIQAVHAALFPTLEQQQQGARVYLADLDPLNDNQGWLGGQQRQGAAGLQIFDPWGSPYEYRVGPNAINPDFDLWSRGPDGETVLGGGYDPNAPSAMDDIRGW